MLQRFNSVLLQNSLPVDLPGPMTIRLLILAILAFLVFNSGDL